MTATICGVQLTPTHDGEAAVVVELLFPNGGRSKVHITGEDAAMVTARAGVDTIDGLVGLPWSVLEIRRTRFMGRVDRPADS